MSNLQKHGEWTDEAAAQDEAVSEQSQSGFLDALPEGDTTLRFLPPAIGKRSPFAVAYVHWFNRADGSRGMVNCPRMMIRSLKERGYDVTGANGFCPLCKKMDDMKASKSPADQRAAKKLVPKLRVYANVIDRDNEAAGVQKYAFGKMVYDGLMSIRNNPKKGGKFTDVEQGRDIIITRSGTKQNDTEYSCAADMTTSPIHPDPGQADEWLEQLADLDQFLTVPTAQEVIAKVKGEDADDDAPTPTPASRPRPAARGARTASEDATSFDPNELESE